MFKMWCENVVNKDDNLSHPSPVSRKEKMLETAKTGEIETIPYDNKIKEA